MLTLNAYACNVHHALEEHAQNTFEVDSAIKGLTQALIPLNEIALILPL